MRHRLAPNSKHKQYFPDNCIQSRYMYNSSESEKKCLYLKQLLEIGIFLHILIFERTPLCDRFAVVYKNLEECVHQQNSILLNGASV